MSVLLSKEAAGIYRAIQLANSDPVVYKAVQISLCLCLGNFLRAHRLSYKLPLILQLAYRTQFAQLNKVPALHIYQRAYRSPQGSKYPLKKLSHLLLLDSEEEAADLCRHFGLATDGDQVIFKTGVEPKPLEGEQNCSPPRDGLKLLENVRPSRLLLDGQSF